MLYYVIFCYNLFSKIERSDFLEYRYRPSGVCSSEFIIVMDGEIIKSVKKIRMNSAKDGELPHIFQ